MRTAMVTANWRGCEGGLGSAFTNRNFWRVHWPAAALMLKRYGDKALERAADGDHDGADTWRRITAAVEQLANTTPPGPVH
jgi:hypothetical protein